MDDNNVIIKALECCVNDKTCDNCPFKSPEDDGCRYVVADFDSIVLDFIKYQRAKIERLEEQNVRLNKECDHYIDFASTARAEAIKEFAEQLKDSFGYGWLLGSSVKTHIDNLVKELMAKDNEYGHWTRELIRNEKGGCIGAKMICSYCGQDNEHDEYMQYCPNCGTKMKEKLI